MSKIQWTGRTSIPFHLVKEDGSHGGHWCRKVSPGCASCYSESQNQKAFFPWASKLKFAGKMPENMILDEAELDTWLTLKKEVIFVNSMTDTFLEEIPDEWLDKVFATMACSPHKTFQILTKRPKRAREYFEKRQMNQIPAHIWFGVTTEDQARFEERVPELLKIPAAIRFLSCEPLLERLDLSRHLPIEWSELAEEWIGSWPGTDCYDQKISWVIVGGESGSGARECRLDWVRSLVNQCQAANVPPFVKQLGSNCIGDDGKRFKTRHPKGGDIEEFPEDVKVWEMPTTEIPQVLSLDSTGA